jgi:hypothetical protein
VTRALLIVAVAVALAMPTPAPAREGRGGGRPAAAHRGHVAPRHRWHGGGRHHLDRHRHHHHHFRGPRVFLYGGFGPYWYPGWGYRPYFYPYYPYYPAYPYPYPYAGVPYPVEDEPDDEPPPPEDADTVSYGLIRLAGVPDGAEVELDGRFWLTAHDLDDRWLALPEGEHRLVVTREGRESIVRTVRIVPGRTHVLTFVTEPRT